MEDQNGREQPKNRDRPFYFRASQERRSACSMNDAEKEGCKPNPIDRNCGSNEVGGIVAREEDKFSFRSQKNLHKFITAVQLPIIVRFKLRITDLLELIGDQEGRPQVRDIGLNLRGSFLFYEDVRTAPDKVFELACAYMGASPFFSLRFRRDRRAVNWKST
ncbi:MAG: hypothetical protein M3O74_00310 [Pseudomonadota bacterium]|jgi:hypothetical protein|uniref:hypothetical protein n=1 Tax=Burkholderia sp. PAMC 28687 TaxID=1795874 RepID=UPI0012D84ADB|nr:hypothetical protein [Burkholderia sp. PAMC 28687]MDP9152666.1 hypothetical protein [Pseudomonadota bacterium]